MPHKTNRAALDARLCRWCLLASIRLSYLALGIACGVAFIYAPQLVLVGLLLAVIAQRRGGWSGSGWLHGTGRWATSDELLDVGMLSGNGMPLGRVASPAQRKVFRALKHAKGREIETLCALAFASRRKRGVKVYANRSIHTLLVAGAGRGKSTGLIIPYLLECDSCMVVLDIKGELFLATAAARQQMGHKVVVLDFWNQATHTTDRWNPLDLIHPDDRDLLDMARAMAQAIVVRTGLEPERHWNDAAEEFIAACIAAVCNFEDKTDRDLATVARILASAERRAKLIEVLYSLGRLYAPLADKLLNYRDKELASVMTTVSRHLQFLSTLPVVFGTGDSTFDPRELVSGKKMTIYLVIPPHLMEVQSGLMRLWVTSLFRMMSKSGLKDRCVRFVLDEAVSLGRLEPIEKGLAQLRGYGVRLTLVYQSLGQLKLCFPQDQDQTVLSNCDTQIYFGINDTQSATDLSKRLGCATVTKTSESGGSSSSTNYDPHGMPSRSLATNAGYTVDEMERPLLRPEEVMQLDERTAIVFTPGVSPIMTRLVRAYEKEYMEPPVSKFGMVIRSVALLLGGVALAASAVLLVLHT